MEIYKLVKKIGCLEHGKHIMIRLFS